MTAHTTTSRDGALREQALRELEKRALPGIAGYLLAWLAVMFSQPAVRETTVAIVLTVVALGLSAARVALTRVFDDLVARDADRARLVLLGLVLANALMAGVIGLLTLVYPPFEDARTLVIVIGAVISAVGTMALALEPVLRIGIPLVLLGPYAIGLAAAWTPEDVGLAAVMILYCGYLSRSSKYLHDDWWRAAELSFDQEARAAELERLSITDGLTLLTNRVAFDRQLESEWARAERAGSILSVLLIDLDHFKAINDTFGHAAGDACLVAAARAVEGCAQRRSDVVSRHGGEEFAVLLPETAAPAAMALAEEMREAVEAIRVDVAGETVALSASIGVATRAPTRSAGEPHDLVDAADAALYVAKRAGRNRVETAELPV